MDPGEWGLQFLDLSGITEADQSHIEKVLSTPPKYLLFPWSATKEDENVGEEGAVGDQEWIQMQYDEQEQSTEIEGEREEEAAHHSQQAPRNNPVYQPMVYLVHPPPGVYMNPLYNSPQHYGYPDLESAPRPHPHPRNGKKMEKKQDPNFPVAQYVLQYSQPIYPPAMFHPVQIYTDYSTFMPTPEQGATFAEEPAYAPTTTPLEIPQHEVKEEPAVVESSAAEFPTHEHLCYHANVTLKAPKKKQPEEVVAVEQPPVEPVASDPVELSQDLEPALESESDECVESAPLPVKVERSSRVRQEFPDLGPSTDTAPSVAPVNNNVRSWVSLFSSSSDDASPLLQPADVKTRPLARVPPFDKNAKPDEVLVKTETASLDLTPPTRQPSIIDDPYSQCLGEHLSTYKLDHRAASLQPRGLTNRSNWCYVNAILQALIACPSFYNLMKSLPVPSCKRSNSRTPIIDVLVEFVNLFSALPPNTRTSKRDKWNKDDPFDLPAGVSFEPSGVYKVLDKIRGENGFTVEGRQEDAEEFLSCLLNGLNDEMFEILKLVDNGAPITNGEASEPERDGGWKEKMPRKNKGSVTRRTVCGKTPISDIFRGQLRNRVQRAGDEYTDNVQPFFTLQLDVEKASSVKEALELLVGKDPLEGMTCSKTNQEIEAWTQISLEDLPLILILHLKCFDYKQDGCSKIMKNVAFNVELKVDPKLMSVNKTKYVGKQRIYKLVAVVYHDGKEATKGHYVTDAYHVGLGCWIRYDDGSVRSVSEESVLKPKSPRVPYLLYYRRADTFSVPTITQSRS